MDQTQNNSLMLNNLNNNNVNFFNLPINIDNYGMNQNIFFYQNNQINPIQNQMMMMPNQMMNNLMQINLNNKDKNEKYEDLYYYIKEDKKKIKFIRIIDNESFKILVPCSLRKNELYYTAKRYKKFKFSEMQLLYKGRFIGEDETSIDFIQNDDEIKIIEVLHGVDFSYYELYLLKHKNEPKINVHFSFSNGTHKVFRFVKDTSIEEMIKILFFEIYVPDNKRKFFNLLYNGETLNFYDKSTLKEKNIQNDSNIFINYQDSFNIRIRNGKPLQVLIKDKNNNFEAIAGTLQSIKGFYSDTYNNYYQQFDSIKIKINGKEFKKDDERTFSSYGIRDNFICYVEYNEKK